jgi:hypothetical protein
MVPSLTGGTVTDTSEKYALRKLEMRKSIMAT